MRLLFSFIGGLGGGGHFEPLAPIAAAAASAGHDVAFACSPDAAVMVEARGFRTFAAGPNGLPPVRRPLLEPSVERELRDLRERFVPAAAVRAAALLEVFEAWRPDAVVHDEGDFGAPIAAERAGVRHAMVLVLAAGSLLRPEVVAEPLDAVRASYGLPPDPRRLSPSRHLVVSPFPPSLRDPRSPLPEKAYSIRLATAPLASGDAVYVTLGTSFNLESGDLFPRLLAGLRGRRAIVTVGRQIDPAELGPQPPEVRVERFVDQAQVLPECCAMVSHGGSGGLLGALAHGLPSVLLPMGADQPDNAVRCEALGVARVLHPVRATPDDIAEAVTAVVDQPAYRAAAVRLHHEIAALPGPERAVELLEALSPSGPAPARAAQ